MTIVDYRAMIWLDTYNSDNAAVQCLQFGIIGYDFTCCHRSWELNKNADALSSRNKYNYGTKYNCSL